MCFPSAIFFTLSLPVAHQRCGCRPYRVRFGVHHCRRWYGRWVSVYVSELLDATSSLWARRRESNEIIYMISKRKAYISMVTVSRTECCKSARNTKKYTYILIFVIQCILYIPFFGQMMNSQNMLSKTAVSQHACLDEIGIPHVSVGHIHIPHELSYMFITRHRNGHDAVHTIYMRIRHVISHKAYIQNAQNFTNEKKRIEWKNMLWSFTISTQNFCHHKQYIFIYFVNFYFIYIYACLLIYM